MRNPLATSAYRQCAVTTRQPRRRIEHGGDRGVSAGALQVAVESADHGGVIAAFRELELEYSLELAYGLR
jgi:hypothetical protein